MEADIAVPKQYVPASPPSNSILIDLSSLVVDADRKVLCPVLTHHPDIVVCHVVVGWSTRRKEMWAGTT